MRFAVLSALLLIALWYFRPGPEGFSHIQFQCSVYNREGQLIFRVPNHSNCAFHPDGSVLAAEGATRDLTLFDRNDQPLWSATESVHHDMSFTADGESFLVMTDDILNLGGARIRSDCFSVRDLQNKIRHKWCVGEHLSDLKKLGFHFEPLTQIAPDNRMHSTDPLLEISHANSFFEIPPNPRTDEHPAFAAGNYLINLYTPSYALLILDRELKHILWSKDMSQFRENRTALRIDTHDQRVEDDGNILAYFNVTHPNPGAFFNTYGICGRKVMLTHKIQRLLPRNSENICRARQNRFSRLVRYNPLTDEIVWQYKDSPPENFNSLLQGSVRFVKPDHYLYSDITRGGAAFEITADGRKVWSFIPPVTDSAGQPLKAQSIKPVLATGFLKTRELL